MAFKGPLISEGLLLWLFTQKEQHRGGNFRKDVQWL